MMKRNDYEKPTMKVVKLQHHRMLMTSGKLNATLNNDGLWVEEDL